MRTLTVDELQIRKAELEQWLLGHEDNPNEPVIREEYRQVIESLESGNKLITQEYE